MQTAVYSADVAFFSLACEITALVFCLPPHTFRCHLFDQTLFVNTSKDERLPRKDGNC